MRRLILLLPVLIGCASSSVATDLQSDWSGGDGQPGPVTEWQAEFDSNSDLSWLSVPGQLALSSTGLSVAVRHSLASGQFGAFGIETADLDQDGDVDIIGAAESVNKVTIWHNNGATPPTFTAEVLDGAYSLVSAVFAADLDGDQDLDLVACSGTFHGRVTCYLNQGGSPATWITQVVDSSWGEAWEISTGDVDNDGLMDIVGTSLGRDSIVWWRNDGQSPIGWTRQTVTAAFDGAHTVRAGDLNGDGATDLVGGSTLGNEIAWWESDGGDPVVWTKRIIDGAFDGAKSVRIGDLDGDGDPDLGAVGFNGVVQWWSNEGGDPVVWDPQIVDSTLSLVHQLQLADITGDGRLEMIVASYGSHTLAWYENGGGSLPITWTRYRSGFSLNRPLAVAAGDVDNDGALELVGSSNTTGVFNWYDVSTFKTAGSLTSSIVDRGSDGAVQIGWSAEVPAGTSLGFQVRSGESPAALGPWSAGLTAPGSVAEGSGRYLQYRVDLASTSAAASPLLREVRFDPGATAVPSSGARFGLSTYPNPANPRVRIAFELPRSGAVRLEIYDVRGSRVRVLADDTFAAGENVVAWDGTDGGGRSMSSGAYYVRLQSPQGIQQSRITLVR